MTGNYSIALIPGDGIGTEVVAEAVKVLSALAPTAGFTFETTEYDLGARRYTATGELLPEYIVEELRGADAILLGAIECAPGGPRTRGVAAIAVHLGPPREPSSGQALSGSGGSFSRQRVAGH